MSGHPASWFCSGVGCVGECEREIGLARDNAVADPRTVACVSACRGIPTEALENGELSKAIWHLHIVSEPPLPMFREQRDTVRRTLAALRPPVVAARPTRPPDPPHCATCGKPPKALCGNGSWRGCACPTYVGCTPETPCPSCVRYSLPPAPRTSAVQPAELTPNAEDAHAAEATGNLKNQPNPPAPPRAETKGGR